MKRIALAFVLLLTSVLAPAAVSAGETQTPTTGAVWGTVTASSIGVKDICVRLWVGSDDTEHEVTTNYQGVYEISKVPAGSYTVRFSDCEGGAFDVVDKPVTVVAEGAAQVDAQLSLADGYGAIVGTVTDAETQDPIHANCVKLYQSEDDILVRYTLTGENGTYVLAAEAGTYRVRFVSCEGNHYVEQWYANAEGWEGSTVVTIPNGGFEDGINAAMVPDENVDAVVWGHVVDGSTADPVHNYCVSLYLGDDKIKTKLTGEAGGYEFVVDPGEYRVKAWACEGHEDLGTVWYLDAEEFADARIVELGSAAEKELDTIVVGDVRFRDAIDNHFHDDIVWLAEQGITLGCNAEGTEFCPGSNVTRGQMAAFLRRALEEVLEAGDPVKFTDDNGSPFEADIEWLASVGVTLGCNAEGTKFCPNDEVSREQMAAFLYRALKDLLVGGEPVEFGDDDTSHFEDEIEWLASVGVTTGCEVGSFCPDDSVIRSHMAAFLHRALGES